MRKAILKSLVVGLVSALTSQGFGQIAPIPSTQIPPVILEHVLRHVKFLKQRSEERIAIGSPATKTRDYYKESAQLSQAEADAVEVTALALVSELDALDARAVAIIKAARPAPLNRRLLPGERPPAPPQELFELQKQREAVVLGMRERLKQAIGAGAFAKLEQALITKQKTGKLKPTATTVGPAPSNSNVR